MLWCLLTQITQVVSEHAEAHFHPTLFYGSHMLLSTSTTQGVIALSSGESEFYALVKATSAGLGAV